MMRWERLFTGEVAFHLKVDASGKRFPEKMGLHPAR
jgi:hypothetical protein